MTRTIRSIIYVVLHASLVIPAISCVKENELMDNNMAAVTGTVFDKDRQLIPDVAVTTAGIGTGNSGGN